MQGHRQSLTLTQPQRDFLSAEAARLGVTVSEVVRRIVDQYRMERNARIADRIRAARASEREARNA